MSNGYNWKTDWELKRRKVEEGLGIRQPTPSPKPQPVLGTQPKALPTPFGELSLLPSEGQEFTTETGEKFRVMPDYSIYSKENKYVGKFDLSDPLNPKFIPTWTAQAMNIAGQGLKALEYATLPITWAGMGGRQFTHTLVEAVEQPMEAIARWMGRSIYPPEVQKAKAQEPPAYIAPIGEGENIFTTMLPSGATYEKHRKLPLYEQIIYELPAWLVGGWAYGAWKQSLGLSAKLLPQKTLFGLGLKYPPQAISPQLGKALLARQAAGQLYSEQTIELITKPAPTSNFAKLLQGERIRQAVKSDLFKVNTPEQALARPIRTEWKQTIDDAARVRGRTLDQLDTLEQVSMADVTTFGHTKYGKFIFEVTPDGIVKPNIHIAPKVAGAQYHLIQILENPSLVKLSPQGRHLLKAMRQSLDDIVKLLDSKGIKINEIEIGGAGQPEVYIPRWVTNKAGVVLDRPSGYLRGFGSLNKRERVFALAIEGIQDAGLKYVEHPMKILGYQWAAAKKRIAQKLASDTLKPLTKYTIAEARQARGLIGTLERLIAGKVVPETRLRAIEKQFPELGIKIRGAIAVKNTQRLKELLAQATTLYEDRIAIYAEPERIFEDAARELLQARKTVRYIKGTLNGLDFTEAIGYDLAKAIDTGLPKSMQNALLKLQQSLVAARAPTRATLRRQLTEAQAILAQAEKNAYRARATRTRMVAAAAQELGEARIPLAGFGNRVFKNITVVGKNGQTEVVTGNEVVKRIVDKLGDEVSWVIRLPNTIASTLRLMKASLDASPALIQLITHSIRHPRAWTEAWVKGAANYINPAYTASWIRKPENFRAALEFARYAGMLGEAEFTEAAGMLSRAALRIPKIGKVLSGFTELTFGRGNQVFTGTRSIGVINIWKGMYPWAKATGHERDLALFLNRSTGFFSLRGIGMKAQMREFLSAYAFFAPRFTIANTVLLSDTLKGGVRGKLARESLGSMIMGNMLLYIAACKAAGQEPKLDPRPKSAGGDGADFGSIQIGNINISPLAGVWSLMRAFIALGSDTYDMIESGRFDAERLLRPFRARTSMFTAYFWDIITGRGYIGEPTRESITGWGKYTGEQALPIWVEGTIQAASEGGKPGVLALIAATEFMGGRTFPEPIWDEVRGLERLYIPDMPTEWLTAYQKILLEDKGGLEWQDLRQWQKNELLNLHPDLKQKREEAIIDSREKWGATDEVKIDQLIETYTTVKNERLGEIAQAVIAGDLGLKDYIDERNEAKIWTSYRIDALRDFEELKDPGLIEYWEREREKRGVDPADTALEGYWEIRANPPKDPTTKLEDWDGHEANLNYYLNSLSPYLKEYVLAHRFDWIRTIPAGARAVEELIIDCEGVLDQYYSVPQGELRLDFRTTTPEVDAKLLILGRVTTLKSPEAIPFVHSFLDKYDVSMTMDIWNAILKREWEAGRETKPWEEDWEEKRRAVEEALGIK